jgi:hypothetical protein
MEIILMGAKREELGSMLLKTCPKTDSPDTKPLIQTEHCKRGLGQTLGLRITMMK